MAIHKDVTEAEAVALFNDFVDKEMPNLTGAEVKLALVIFRKTIGWFKLSDSIGLTQLADLSGMNRTTAQRNMDELCRKMKLGRKQVASQGVLGRTYFTWPISESAEQVIRRIPRRKCPKCGHIE